ncbi:PAS domain-containing sensor histidine kinase [Ferviditalea candida]|uniref:histidine kinase n=1 Tax=Ferviditalea candida TaxID=3108399 RepID=A0ABU5ZJB3_9BACL|nr:PAS domain S-box protein [Paenibacillaceae bacterium T2]
MQIELFYQLIAEHTSDLISIMDLNGIIQNATPSHQCVLGIEFESFEQTCVFDYIHPDDLPIVKDAFQLLVETRQPIILQIRYRHANGSYLQLKCRLKPLLTEDNGDALILAICRDITKRAMMENALMETESKYRSLVEESLVGVYITQNWILQYVNPCFARIYGYEVDEMIGTEVLSYIVPEQREFVADIIRKRLDNNSTPPYQMQIIKKDGSIAHLEVHGALTVYNGKPATTGTVVDITDRIKSEQAVRRSEKLAVVGELAAGIGHEIRNPLTAIKGFLQLMDLEKLKNMEYRNFILTEIDRVNLIVNEFMMLAKPQVRKYEEHALATILNEVVTLLSSQAALVNVEIVTRFESDGVMICDKNLFKQVFVNLIKNAIESMPKGGRVVVQLECLNQTHVIRVTDEGCGIPESRIHRLGEHFYSTKEKGTGLGLMTSFKIIQEHNGEVRIESALDRGTTVEIILPKKLF